jgi:hypothetical protein
MTLKLYRPEIPLPPSTPELDAITTHVTGEDPSLVVDALAGSGKSSAVKRCIAHLSTTLRLGYCVFNVRNRDEFEEWLNAYNVTGVTCKTINGIGSGIVRGEGLSYNLAPYKIRTLTEHLYPAANSWFVEDTIRFARAYGYTTGDQLFNHFIDLLDCQGLNPPDDPPLDYANICRTVFNASINHRDHDFDDQWHWPLLFGVVTKQFDILFIDEAQDLSLGKWLFLKQLSDHIVALGDRNQAIQGWLGAQGNILDRIQTDLSCPSLPLTISWRCSTSVISHAQTYVPTIQARPNAPTGRVSVTGHLAPSTSDMVLCRINSPLVAEFFRTVEQGLPACLLGHDLVHALRVVFDKAQRSRNPYLTIEQWYHKKLLKARNDKAKDMLMDQMETALLLYQKLYLKLDKVSEVFVEKPTPDSVVFSSVHRSKGLEGPTIWHLPGRFPTRNLPDWLMVQEAVNLPYVSVTRAKLNYNIIEENYNKD